MPIASLADLVDDQSAGSGVARLEDIVAIDPPAPRVASVDDIVSIDAQPNVLEQLRATLKPVASHPVGTTAPRVPTLAQTGLPALPPGARRNPKTGQVIPAGTVMRS